jgi:hypothetical protein
MNSANSGITVLVFAGAALLVLVLGFSNIPVVILAGLAVAYRLWLHKNSF